MLILSARDFQEITRVCRVIRVTAECDICGAVVTAMHAPEVTWGFYCRKCCPCRWYKPSDEERRAMRHNRARLAGRQLGRASSAAPVEWTHREAALRQWADPKARKKIMAGIRRGKRARRQG